MSFFDSEGGSGTSTDNGEAGAVVTVSVGAGVGGGDIWSSGAFAFESPLKDLLDSGTYTMEDLLAEDELLQELRGMHPQLVDYFSTEESLTRLVKHLTMTATPSQRQSHQTVTAEQNTPFEEESTESSSGKHQPEVTVPNTDGSTTTVMETVREQDKEGGTAGAGVVDIGAASEESESSLATIAGVETTASSSGVHAPSSQAPQDPAASSGDYDLECIRFPYMACEVICCKIGSIVDILVDGYVAPEQSIAVITSAEAVPSSEVDGRESDERNTANSGSEGDTMKPTATSEGTETAIVPRTPLIDLLFSVLSDASPGQLDDRRAGYLEKVVSVLFQHRPGAMSSYINGDVVGTRNFGNGGLALLTALFRQIHSHSVTQIVQRLLLPPPPSTANFSSSPQSVQAPGDLTLDSDINGAVNQSPGSESASGEAQEGDSSGWAVGSGEGEESLGGAIVCNWCQHAEAFDLLLSTLAGRNQVSSSELEDESLFDASQNAADVLITIIQNSVLTSPNIKFLTTDPALNQITDIIRAVVRGANSAVDEPEEKVPNPLLFSRHESLLTTAMSVLESLVLQLGGYGAVAAAPLPPPPPPQSVAVEGADSTLIIQGTGEEGSALGSSNTGLEAVANAGKTFPAPPSAGTLVQHLPDLLDSMSELLTHSITESWVSPVQYDMGSSAHRHLLGVSRLRMVRLLEALVLLGNPRIDAILCRSDCLEKCLDLFWAFPWCSMLHQSVANFLVHILEGADERVGLQEYLVIRCDLPRRLMDSFETSPVARATTERTAGSTKPSTTNEKSLAGTDDDTSDMVMVHSSPEQNVSDNDNIDAGCGDEAVVLESPASNGIEGESDVLTSDGVVLGTDAPDTSEEVQSSVETVPRKGEAVAGTELPTQLKDGSSEPKNTTLPTFRLGYMGHVIIVCQAFVHACNASNILAQPDGNQTAAATDAVAAAGDSIGVNGEVSGAVQGNSFDSSGGSSVGGLLPDSKPHVPTTGIMAGPARMQRPEIVNILQRLDAYPRWERFVKTTLAEEVTVQSTPLGGFPGPPGAEMGTNLGSLQHAQAGDAGITGESSSEGTGHFDDNDLEIAASMMEAISLPGTSTSPGSASAINSERAKAGREESGPSEYFFDDPLGRRKHFEDQGDEDDSDEEEPAARHGKLPESESSGEKDYRGEDHDEVPVMNLFAGNFSFGATGNDNSESGDGNGQDGVNETKSDWANFANFENAFGSDAANSVNEVSAEVSPHVEGSSGLDGDTFVKVGDDRGQIAESLFEGVVADDISDPFEAAEPTLATENTESGESVDFFSSPTPKSTIDLLSEGDEGIDGVSAAENTPLDVEVVATEGHVETPENDKTHLVESSSEVDVSRKKQDAAVVGGEDNKDGSIEEESGAMDPAEVSSQPVMVSP